MTSGRAAAGRFLLMCSLGCMVTASVGMLQLPSAYASSKADRELGAAVFHEKGCEQCHGVDGVGTERGPDLSSVGRLLHPPEIQRQIHDGGKQMPAFGEALTSDEIQQLVAFLGTKKKKIVAHSKAN
jgi:mono/diheme cytochrome c family protein